jgi:methionine-rich copper-binding protein CopC
MRIHSTFSSLPLSISTLAPYLQRLNPLLARYSVPSLILLLPGVTLAHPTISSLSPRGSANNADRTSSVQVMFSTGISASSSTALKVFSSQRGGLRTASAPAMVSGRTLTFTPSAYAFQPGEMLLAVVTTAVAQNNGNALAAPYIYQFTTATKPSTGTLGPRPTIQRLLPPKIWQLAT